MHSCVCRRESQRQAGGKLITSLVRRMHQGDVVLGPPRTKEDNEADLNHVTQIFETSSLYLAVSQDSQPLERRFPLLCQAGRSHTISKWHILGKTLAPPDGTDTDHGRSRDFCPRPFSSFVVCEIYGADGSSSQRL